MLTEPVYGVTKIKAVSLTLIEQDANKRPYANAIRKRIYIFLQTIHSPPHSVYLQNSIRMNLNSSIASAMLSSVNTRTLFSSAYSPAKMPLTATINNKANPFIFDNVVPLEIKSVVLCVINVAKRPVVNYACAYRPTFLVFCFDWSTGFISTHLATHNLRIYNTRIY